MKVDPLGLGTHVRNKMTYSDWKSTDWHEEFFKMDVELNIKVKFKNVGKWK
jgi:spore germination protein